MTIGYVRGSTSQQITTLQVQREKIEAYAKAHDLGPVEIIEDEATTSRIPLAERDGGRLLIQAIKEKTAGAVIISAFDRAFRSVHEALGHMDAWDKAGVTVHILDIGGSAINTKSATGRMLFTLLACVAEWERRRIAERTKEAHLSSQAKGKLITGVATIPYGYKLTSGKPGMKNGKIGPCEKEQAVLGLIMKMDGEGKSAYKIASTLNKRGITPRTAKKWRSVTIQQIIERTKRERATAEAP